MKLGQTDKWFGFCVAVAVWGMLEVIMLVLVPIYADLHDEFGGRLPAYTRLVFSLGRFPGALVIPFFLAGAVAFQTRRVYNSSPSLQGRQPIAEDRRFSRLFILLGVLAYIFVAYSLWWPFYIPAPDEFVR